MDPQAVVEHAHSDVPWGAIATCIVASIAAAATIIGAWFTLRSRVKTAENSVKALAKRLETINGSGRVTKMESKLDSLSDETGRQEKFQQELFGYKNELMGRVTTLESLVGRVDRLERTKSE